MFSVAASVLKDFAKRKHGGEIGFTIVLHTHSRQRNLHPHLHIIVASGSYNKRATNGVKARATTCLTPFHWLKSGERECLIQSITTLIYRWQTQATKTSTLPTLLFLWLILQHVLPKGLQRVRDYGFLHGNAKRLRVHIQAILLHQFNGEMQLLTTTTPSKVIRICPCCQH